MLKAERGAEAIVEAMQLDDKALHEYWEQYAEALPTDFISKQCMLLNQVRQLLQCPLEPELIASQLEVILSSLKHAEPHCSFQAIGDILRLRGDLPEALLRSLSGQLTEAQQAEDSEQQRHGGREWQLAILVRSGEGFQNKKNESKAYNPFVKLKMSNARGDTVHCRRVTRVVRRAVDPVWEQRFTDFPARDVARFEALRLEVWSKNNTLDELVSATFLMTVLL